MRKVKILCVEDNPGDARIIKELFNEDSSDNFEITFVENLEKVKNVLNDTENSIILLDLSLPESSGMDTLEQMKIYAPETPIIVLTGREDEKLAEKIIQSGAQDYLIKGRITTDLLIHSLRYARDRHIFVNALKEKQEQFINLIEKNSDGILVVNEEGILKYLNPSCEKLFSRTREELLNQSVGFPISFNGTTEISVLGKDGNIKTLEMSTSEILWEDEICSLAALRDVTEHKLAENKIKILADTWQATFNSIEDFIMVISKDFEIMEINKAGCEILNQSREEIVGKKCCEVVHDCKSPIKLCPCLKGFHTGKTETVELNLSETSFLSTSWPMLDEKGEIIAFTHSFKDISERKRAEEALRKSSEKFQMLYDSAPIGLYRTTPDGEIVLANRALVEMLGFSSFDELSARNLKENGFETFGQRKQFIEQIEKEGEIKDLVSKWICKNGEVIIVKENAKVISDSKGNVLYYDGTVEDITRFRKAEEQNRQLTMAVNKTDNAIVIADKTGRIEWVNEGFQKLTGYNIEEVKDTFGDMLNPAMPTCFNPDSGYYREMVRTGKPISYETQNRTKSGKEYWVLTTLSPILDCEGNVEKFIAIDSDISKIKQIQEDLINTKKQLENTTKLKDIFLANMSHEIRTPMNAIIGFSDILSAKKLEKKEKEYVSAIKSAGENLMAVINDILDISKIEAGMMTFEERAFSMKDIFISLNILQREKAKEKNIELLFGCDENVPDVLLGDPIRLNQIIINLTGNAIKFTTKGSVQVHAKVLKNECEIIFIEISVIDTGIGIPRDKLEQIFERFQQAETNTAREYGGTGLGLSIVKQLVELQGGFISVKSEYKAGSEFSFCIPYKKTLQTYVASEMPEKEFNIEELSRLKILLAEDSPFNIMLISSLFSENNLNVEVTKNGSECIEKLKETDFDIILMDMEMPVMNGYEATGVIRNELKNNIPIIAMTAHAMEGEREKCLSFGMNDYVSKPIDANLLFKKMYELTINS